MKAKLEFNLDDPDDALRHKLMLKSNDMSNALWEITYTIRRKYTRNFVMPKEDYYDVIDDIFKDINEVLECTRIDLDELL